MHFRFLLLFLFLCIVVIILILIVVKMMKRRQRISHVKKIMLTSYTVKPADEEGNHECIYPNPTYQDTQVSERPVDVSPNPTFQDVHDEKAIDISPNPNFQDAQDNEFSVQIEN